MVFLKLYSLVESHEPSIFAQADDGAGRLDQDPPEILVTLFSDGPVMSFAPGGVGGAENP